MKSVPYNIPSPEEFKRRFCEDNLNSPNPRKCEVCGSKYMYYNSTVGPIVGGFAMSGEIPNAHPTGMWICFDCQMEESKKQKEYERKQKIKEAPSLIKKKEEQIKDFKKEISDLKKLVK